jgi:hypothetical protein
MPNPLPRIILSPLQMEAITGSLLGDGTLNRKKNRGGLKVVGNVSFTIARALEDLEYLQYEAKLFNNCFPSTSKNIIKCSSIFDKREKFNRYYHKCRFTTCANITFTESHNKWYRQNDKGENIKIIPSDLQLSSLIIAHWFADDGSITLNATSRLPRFEVRFSTEGFTKDEVQFLISLLENRYNEKFSMYNRKQGNGQQYIISGLDSASRTMISDIDLVFHMQRKRLWDNPITRYYIDPPKRAINREQYLKDKQQSFFDELSLHEEISAYDLSKQLNYWFISKSGDRNEPNYHMLNKMIKPYINSGQVKKLQIAPFRKIIFKINRPLIKN